MNGGSAVLDVEGPHSRLFRRRRVNRRIQAQSRAAEPRTLPFRRALLRSGWALVKVVVFVAALAGSGWGVGRGIRHVVNSPRFQLRTIDFSPTPHLGQSEMLALAGIAPGDRLLGIDTDDVAAKIAAHPWVASVRASRRLPAALVVEVTERRAVAAVALAGLYLLDESGRPFKRATMEEADGLPVLTGIERERYVEMRDVSEAAFRDALGVLEEYRSRPGRPPVSEINIEPGFGYSLFLLEGGAEIRLGRRTYSKKLAQFDRILEAVLARQKGGLSSLRMVHLDLPEGERVPVLLRETGAEKSAAPAQLAKN